MVELKSQMSININGQRWSLNRTMVEFKFGNTLKCSTTIFPLNRTMVELKLGKAGSDEHDIWLLIVQWLN